MEKCPHFKDEHVGTKSSPRVRKKRLDPRFQFAIQSTSIALGSFSTWMMMPTTWCLALLGNMQIVALRVGIQRFLRHLIITSDLNSLRLAWFRTLKTSSFLLKRRMDSILALLMTTMCSCQSSPSLSPKKKKVMTFMMPKVWLLFQKQCRNQMVRICRWLI